jgi:hypothetical protein
MAWNSPRIQSRTAQLFLGLASGILSAAVDFSYAGSTASNGPQIEYIAPDGKLCSLSAENLDNRQSPAVFVDNDTVSCRLKEGETTFIIELPKDAARDRFTFLNENADACGELRIAVSDSALPADSPKWTEVDGIVPFAHKRLFKLSMLGVETKFVRLSFKVDGQENKSAQVMHPFQASMLADAINSNFARLRAHRHDLNFAAISVAPLSAASFK